MNDGRKVVDSKLPPGGGACHRCARPLYRDQRDDVRMFYYWSYNDDQGISRAIHMQCKGNSAREVGADDPVFDDDAVYRKHLAHRNRFGWLRKLGRKNKLEGC